jgi:hypothetical protein
MTTPKPKYPKKIYRPGLTFADLDNIYFALWRVDENTAISARHKKEFKKTRHKIYMAIR